MIYPSDSDFLHIPGNGEERIVFVHANGYTPESYSPILDRLAEHYSIDCFLLRPLRTLNQGPTIDSWQPLADDLEKFISRYQGEKVVGLGHSVGGNLILKAALRSSDMFSSTILLDPTIFAPYRVYIYRAFYLLGLSERLHPHMLSAKKRRDSYKSEEDIFNSYRKKKVFKKISDNLLRSLISSLFIGPGDDGEMRLAFPTDWEYQIYKTGLLDDIFIWDNIHRLSVPTTIIAPSESDALLPDAIRKIKRMNDSIGFKWIDNSTHLFPFELPAETADIILG